MDGNIDARALADLVAPDRVARESGIGSRRQAFERLGALLAPATGRTAVEIAAALGEREHLGTTGFGGGLALPHGRLPGRFPIAAALLVLDEPLDWMAVDGLPVDLVVALLAPDEAGAGHLKALALVSRSLRDPGLLAKLRGTLTNDALWALVDSGQRKAA